jgi:hypothetical protein
MARPAAVAAADVICINDSMEHAAAGPTATPAAVRCRQLSYPHGATAVEQAADAHATQQQRGRKRRRASSTAAAAPPRRSRRRRITAPAEEDIIDLTAEDEDAVAHAFRQWELIDLTGGSEAEAAPGRAEQRAAAAPAAPSAAAAPPAPAVEEDALAPQRASIRAFLAARGAQLRVRRCEANPHAAPGAPLYARFVAARARCADPSVALAFHGTPEANVESICARGLDPRRRKRQVLGAAARRRAQGSCSSRRAKTPLRARDDAKPSLIDDRARAFLSDLRVYGAARAPGKGEYFATDALTSAGYCAGGRKLLVCAVLTDSSGLTAHATRNVLVVHKREHHLVRACVRARLSWRAVLAANTR